MSFTGVQLQIVQSTHSLMSMDTEQWSVRTVMALQGLRKITTKRRQKMSKPNRTPNQHRMKIVSYRTETIGTPEEETEQDKSRKRIKRNMQKKSRRKNRKRQARLSLSGIN